jgi:purine-nucleoside phosphorylase
MITEAESLAILKQRVGECPELVMILGSGWNQVAASVKHEAEISYEELFGVTVSVPGHQGKLMVGDLAGKRVALLVGRFHMYEGYNGTEATLPVRVLAAAGMKHLITTAACGALHEKYRVGDLVLVSDLLTLFLRSNPLVGPHFQDMSEVFDEDMRTVARQVLVENQLLFHEGVYVYYPGPNFETPADKMALKFLGGDVVGMSTIPEAIMARSLGISVLSLALVTNLAFVRHDHNDVLAESNKAAEKMVTLLTQLTALL